MPTAATERPPALHIHRGPDCREETHHIDCKWCFNCRGRYIHTWTILYDSKPSYYEPIGLWACAKCGKDHTGFPGTEWWYE